MLPKQQRKIPISAEVVDLDSSDDEGAAVAEFSENVNKSSNNVNIRSKPPNAQPSDPIDDNANYRSFESRSFWKAGAYEIGPSKSTSFQGGFFIIIIIILNVFGAQGYVKFLVISFLRSWIL